MSIARADLHQIITDRIVAAIEADPGPWSVPWRTGPQMRRPTNVASAQPYRGINTVALWVESQRCGYGSALWGSYRQWAARGGQVRQGEKASLAVFYKELTREDVDPDEDSTGASRRWLIRSSPVFNADQVDGVARDDDRDRTNPVEPVATVESFAAGAGATIVHGGSRAFYSPKLDRIQMPERGAFIGSEHSSAAETYYSTLLHELVHWTGAEGRCDRDLAPRFGSEAYAIEELVAELGAAFLCADLGVTNEPRADHAQYLAHWLRVLKADKRAIFAAAGKAAQALDYLAAASQADDNGPNQRSRPSTATPPSSSIL